MKFLSYIFASQKKVETTKGHLEIQRELEDQLYFRGKHQYDLNSCDLSNYYENKEIICHVFDILAIENIEATMNLYSIHYQTNDLDDHEISLDNIAVEENKLAWFQSSFNENHLLRVFENNSHFNWIPTTHNQSGNCDCHLLEWFEKHLVFIYKEKHHTYICAIRDDKVRSFKFHGESLERKKDIIFFREYGKEHDHSVVRRIKIPELDELEPVSVESLRSNDLIPKSPDVHMGMYLKGK